MGTICAPTYANIFMSEFEERHIYLLIKNKSGSYLRIIDDIFMVWTKSVNELKSFINEINKNHHSIKFDFKFSKEKIEFLDTLVYKDHNNRLQATLYKKPTDCQNYLISCKICTSSFTKKEYSLQSSIRNKTCLLNF